jgi:hypothetical protein
LVIKYEEWRRQPDTTRHLRRSSRIIEADPAQVLAGLFERPLLYH